MEDGESKPKTERSESGFVITDSLLSHEKTESFLHIQGSLGPLHNFSQLAYYVVYASSGMLDYFLLAATCHFPF